VFESYHHDKNKKEGYAKVEQGKKAHFTMPVYRIEPSDCNLKPSKIAFRVGGVDVDWFKKDEHGRYWIEAPKVGTHMVNIAVYEGNLADKSFELKLEVYASKTPATTDKKPCKVFELYSPQWKGTVKTEVEIDAKIKTPMEITLPTYKQKEDCKAKVEYFFE